MKVESHFLPNGGNNNICDSNGDWHEKRSLSPGNQWHPAND